MLAGVCGGLGEFFGISAFWFRLGMILAFIPGGVPGLLIYGLLLGLLLTAALLASLPLYATAIAGRSLRLLERRLRRKARQLGHLAQESHGRHVPDERVVLGHVADSRPGFAHVAPAVHAQDTGASGTPAPLETVPAAPTETEPTAPGPDDPEAVGSVPVEEPGGSGARRA